MMPEAFSPSYATAVTVWLVLSIMSCWVAWISRRGLLSIGAAIALIVTAALMIVISSGTPALQKPPQGQFAVLGFKLVPLKRIYVLLDVGRESPVLYLLPWSKDTANGLQDSQNDGSFGTMMVFGSDGEALGVETNVEPEEPKPVPDWVPPIALPYLGQGD